MRADRATEQPRSVRGFTLVELLVVILIVGILISLVTAAVQKAQQKAKEARAKSDIQTMTAALKNYELDEGIFPGHSAKWDEEDDHFNAFPELFEALCGEKASEGGKGGRNAPYFEPNEDDIVRMDDPQNPKDGTEQVSRDERWDADVPKFLLDPWGGVYYYRENASKKRTPWMYKPKSYDLWSAGPNRENQSNWPPESGQKVDEMGKKIDDIGNWQG